MEPPPVPAVPDRTEDAHQDAGTREIGSHSHEEAAGHRRVLAVVNPVAGLRAIPRPHKDLRRWAERLGIDMELVETRPDLDGEAAVLATPGRFDCLLAVGGDGTVTEVAAAAIRLGVPLAILPRGTANAVAWRFGIPFDVAQALRVAVRGKPLPIDVATTPHGPFLIMAGLGYDAAVIRGATRSLKRRLGFLAYLYSALRNLRRRPYSFRVFLDGGSPIRVRGATAVVADIGSLAGNIRMLKDVDPQDGILDLVVVAPENFGDFFRMVARGLVGRLGRDPRVRHYRAARIRIECRPQAPLQIDGNDVEGTHRELEVEVQPGALTLMVPAETKRFPWMPEVARARRRPEWEEAEENGGRQAGG